MTTVKWRRNDRESIGLLGGIATEAIDLGSESREAIGLMPAQVRDPADPRRARCQCAQGCDDGSEFAFVMQIDVDT